jgi:hypothetical protein
MPRKGSDVQGIYVDALAMQYGQYIESGLLFPLLKMNDFVSTAQ